MPCSACDLPRFCDCREVVPVCVICGRELDADEGLSTCEDCEPSDCIVCGATVPRSSMPEASTCSECVPPESD